MYFKNLNASFTFGRASKPLGFKLLLQIQVMLEIKSNRHCFFCTLTKYKNILELISIFIVILRTSTFHLYGLFRRLLTKPMYFREKFWDIFGDNYWDNFVDNLVVNFGDKFMNKLFLFISIGFFFRTSMFHFYGLFRHILTKPMYGWRC